MKMFGLTLLVAVCGVVQTVFVESAFADEPEGTSVKCVCPVAGDSVFSESCTSPSCTRYSLNRRPSTRHADLKRAGLAPYLVEAPDVLQIKLRHASLKAPVTLQHGDALQIAATGTKAGQELICRSTVSPGGHVRLGKIIGKLRVAGLTQSQCVENIEKQLNREGFISPIVTVTLIGADDIDGEHLVGPDGKIKLGRFGAVAAGVMTIDEIKKAVEEKLAEASVRPRVDVEVLAYNSKVVYVIFEGTASGDQIVRLPCDGSMTVLDAIASASASVFNAFRFSRATKMWVSRPAIDGGPEVKMPIDWRAIAKDGDTSTNHHLLPGDRVFVVAQEKVAKVAVEVASAEVEAKQVGYYQPIEVNRFPVAKAAAKRGKPAVKLELTVLEDTNGNFAEFEPLKNGHVMIADSVATQGTIRILKKNDLIKIVAAPALVCPSGQRASISVGEQSSDGIGESKQYVHVDLMPVTNDESAIRVDVKTSVKIKGQRREMDTSILLDLGKTVILKMRPFPLVDVSHAKAAPPVYLVLTAKLLR